MKDWLLKLLQKILSYLSGGNPKHGILLWGPAYDETTRYTSEWLDNLPVPDRVPTIRLVGKTVWRSEVQASLQSLKAKRRLAIFCGYGLTDMLLGAPQGAESDITVGTQLHSVIYENNMLSNGPEALFAFCDHAGLKLGDRFASLPKRVFLGYTGNIGLLLSNQECRDQWKRIFDAAAVPIIKTGTISVEDKERLAQRCDEVRRYFWFGEGKKNEMRRWMLLYLEDHQKKLCLKFMD